MHKSGIQNKNWKLHKKYECYVSRSLTECLVIAILIIGQADGFYFRLLEGGNFSRFALKEMQWASDRPRFWNFITLTRAWTALSTSIIRIYSIVDWGLFRKTWAQTSDLPVACYSESNTSFLFLHYGLHNFVKTCQCNRGYYGSRQFHACFGAYVPPLQRVTKVEENAHELVQKQPCQQYYLERPSRLHRAVQSDCQSL